ncbi:MAG: MFS transporter [Chloroflexi bacterium]|nr:MFS transporter [Chloroflexota bacterium]
MTIAPTSTPRFASLQHRNFRLLWAGLIVSNTGTWMQNVAQGWLVLQLTNSPFWLGLLGLSFAIPMIFLPLVGGAVVDRIDRIKLLYFTQTGAMLTTLVLAIMTWTGTVHISYILIASFISSALLAFDNPARQALIPELVPQRDLMNAISLNSATYTGAALIGPAIAGMLLAPLGAGSLFFLNSLSYLSVLFALASMRNVQGRSSTARHTSLGKSILAGLSYTWKNRLILALLGLSALAAIFGRSYQNLLPIFARDIWSGGPAGYGILLSASGGGALVGAFGLASIRNVKRQGAILITSGLIFSLTVILFALSPYFWAGVVLLFIGGIAITVFGTIISTFIQIMVPNELRGRVMSLYSITLIGLPSLGALGIGSVAEMLGGITGAPRAVLMGGVIVGSILVITAPLFWQRNVEKLKLPA